MNKKLTDKNLINLNYKLSIFLILFVSVCSELFALENKILLQIDKEIITTQDILNEVKYLKFINSDFKSLDNNKIYLIAKNSLIREIIKENELKRILKKIDIKESFLEEFIINYFSKFNISSINELRQILNQNDLKLDKIKKKNYYSNYVERFNFSKIFKKCKN